MWKLSNLFLLSLFCFPNFLYAAVAHVQSTGISSVGAVASVAKAYAGNVTVNNTLVAGGHCDDGAGYLTGNNFTDSIPNTWVDAVLGPNDLTALAYVITAAAGATTVTLTPAASDFCAFGISEFSGVKQTAPVDGTNRAIGASSTGTVSTTTAGLIYAVMGFHAAAAITEGADLVLVYEDETWTSAALSVVYRITTVAGSYDGNWTVSSPGDSVVAAFIEATGAVTRRPIAAMVFQ